MTNIVIELYENLEPWELLSYKAKIGKIFPKDACTRIWAIYENVIPESEFPEPE